MQDLWPENITEITYKSPLAILKEQAKFLGEKTNNLIVASVGKVSSVNQQFAYQFYIVAPTLDYLYRLFSIQYGVEPYPLEVIMNEALAEEMGGERIEEREELARIWGDNLAQTLFGERPKPIRYVVVAGSEEQFIAILQKLFESKHTRQVVASLLSQIELAIS